MTALVHAVAGGPLGPLGPLPRMATLAFQLELVLPPTGVVHVHPSPHHVCQCDVMLVGPSWSRRKWCFCCLLSSAHHDRVDEGATALAKLAAVSILVLQVALQAGTPK